MALSVINGPNIAAGESLSDGVDCSGGNAVRITMPPAWTPANLTFQVSTDGNGYNDVFDAQGNEIVVPVIPGSAVPISNDWANWWNFVKFRSGTRQFPVPQADVRAFAITLSDVGVMASAAGKKK